jgi:hypothetical protein
MAVSFYWWKREPRYIIQCIWEETTDLLQVMWKTFSHSDEQVLNRRGLEVRGLVVWDRCLNHSATNAPKDIVDISNSNADSKTRLVKVEKIYSWMRNTYIFVRNLRFEIILGWWLPGVAFLPVVDFCIYLLQSWRRRINYQTRPCENPG